MARSDHEPRLRIIIGPSAFSDRSITVWTRLSENKRPKRYRQYSGEYEEHVYLPLIPRQVIITDSHNGSQPRALDGEVFVVTRGPRGWMVDETLIAEGRAYLPQPIASRPIHFDIVRTRTVEA